MAAFAQNLLSCLLRRDELKIRPYPDAISSFARTRGGFLDESIDALVVDLVRKGFRPLSVTESSHLQNKPFANLNLAFLLCRDNN